MHEASIRRRVKVILEGRERGATLLIVLILIPISMSLFLSILTRMEVALADTQRHQQRVQARLLAESALTLYASSAADGRGDAVSLDGAIESVGRYRLTVTTGGEGRRTVHAEGSAPDKWMKTPRFDFFTEIVAEASEPPSAGEPPSLRILKFTQSVQPHAR